MNTPASIKPVTKHNDGTKHSEQPLTTASLRQELLEAAGFDRKAQIKLMKQVIESASDDLEAQKETPGWYEGKLGDVHVQPDHAARARAREQLIDLLGATGKHAGSSHAPQGKIEIPLPPWMQMTFSNQPQPVVVSSVETTSGGNQSDQSETSDVLPIVSPEAVRETDTETKVVDIHQVNHK